MRYLPLVMTRGPLLAEAIRGATQGARSANLCGWCGSRLHTAREGHDQTVQCPGCARLQRLTAQEETPWRLTPSAAEALRRTRSWLRRL